MGLVDFFKKLGNDVKKFATKFFAEDNFVEYDSREDLKAAIVTSGMNREEGSLLVREHDQSVTRGRHLDDVQDRDIIITPADRMDDSTDLEQDSTIRNIRVKETPIPDGDAHQREQGGKNRERSL